MRRLLILFFIILPMGTKAAENLMMNMRDEANVSIIDGTVYQNNPDTRSYMQWKFQAWYKNNKYEYLADGQSFISIWSFNDNQTGFISRTFTTPSDLEDLEYFRFGLNGKERDTTIVFDFKDVLPNTTYTLQWRMLNTTQGEIAWTDMFLTRCGDGYALPLGETNCEQLCTAGITQLHAGENAVHLYNRKMGTPALGVRYRGNMCYGRLTAGTGVGLNVRYNGTTYHLIY